MFLKDDNGNPCLYAGGGFVKYLTVAELITLLDQLPVDTRIFPNTVHNLTACDPEMNYLGSVDFAGGHIEWFDDGTNPDRQTE